MLLNWLSQIGLLLYPYSSLILDVRKQPINYLLSSVQWISYLIVLSIKFDC